MPGSNLTWRGLIRLSLLEIGVIDPGEPIAEGEQTDDAFARLQGMLSEWNMDNLLVPGMQTIEGSLDGGRTTYTIGPAPTEGDAPDFVVPRVIQVPELVEYRIGTNWCEVKKTSLAVITRYEDLSGFFYPHYYFYSQAHPLPTIRFNVRLIGPLPFRISYRPSFGSIRIDDAITELVPPEYQEGIMLNLATKLAPGYGIDDKSGLKPETKAGAVRAKGALRTRNLEDDKAPLDPALMGEHQRRGYYTRRRW